MDLFNTRINRRAFGGITVGVAATAGLGRLVVAQEATPGVEDTEATPVSAATLADLETATQFSVVANNNSYAIYQSGANTPGWYVFSLENASESDASFNLAKLPEGVAKGDFTSFLFQLTSGQITSLPEWLADVTFAGGTYAPVGGSSSVMVNLDAGDWIAFSDLAASSQTITSIRVDEPVAEESEETAATPEVAVATPEMTEPVAVTAPEGFGSSFTVSLADGAINADSSPSAGYNIIGVRNDASMASNFVLIYSAEAVDEAAAADLATAFLAGEESGATLAGGMGMLSTDTFGYIELEAEAGSYVGFSSGVNASGGSQIEDGAVTVLNVG